jgi:hypothetical protein
MSANSKEIIAAVDAISRAMVQNNMSLPSAPPFDDDTDSTHSSSHHSQDLQLHEWELGKHEILRRAEAGDTSCKFLAGIGFAKGHFGFPYDREQANKWLLAAKVYDDSKPDSDTVIRMATKGFCYQFGFGDITRKDINLQEARGMYGGATDYIPVKFFHAQICYEMKTADNPQFVKSRHIAIKRIVDAVQECVDAKFTPAYDFAAHRHFDRWEDFVGGYGAINEREGVKLLKEAEKLGDSPARRTLVTVYYGGGYDGTEKNVSEGHRLLMILIKDKIPGAQSFLDALNKKMASPTTAVAPPPSMIFSPAAIAPPLPVVMQTQNQPKKKKKGGCLVM